MHFIHECVNWICFSVPGSNSFFFHKSTVMLRTQLGLWSSSSTTIYRLVDRPSAIQLNYSVIANNVSHFEPRKKTSQISEQQWFVGISLAISSLFPVRLIHWDSLQCLSLWQQDFDIFIYLGVDEICLLYPIRIRMQPRAEAEPVVM